MSERDRVDKLNHSIMALTTMMLVGVFCYLGIVKILDSGLIANAVTLVLGYWFGQREKAAGATSGKTDANGTSGQSVAQPPAAG